MTEHNFFQEIQEDLERQKYEELWKRYGLWVVVGAVAIILATAGVTAWRSWHTDKNQEATGALIAIIGKDDVDPSKQMGDLESFALKNRGSSQAVFAQLSAAGLAARAGNTDRAVQLYDHVAKDSGADPVFRQFADLMSVRAQMDSGDPAMLEERLHPLLADNAPWHFTAMEYEGYLALRRGDKAKARDVFTELSQNAEVPQTLSARAADMMRYLSE